MDNMNGDLFLRNRSHVKTFMEYALRVRLLQEEEENLPMTDQYQFYDFRTLENVKGV